MNAPDYLSQMQVIAKAAMKNAYAAYSHFSVGCCIRTADNKFFAGCNVENASYPCSQCAEATAIGNMITAGGKVITDVVTMGKEGVFCSPCGNCRQRISEFSTPTTVVHVCTPTTLVQSILLNELLPFNAN